MGQYALRPGTGGGGGAAAPERKIATLTTPAIGRETPHQARITLGRFYQLLEITTSAPARVRLFVSPEGQAADLLRPPGTQVVLTNGVVLDFVTSVDRLSWPLSPMVAGASMEAPTTPDIPITVERYDTETGPVTVTFTYFQTEA